MKLFQIEEPEGAPLRSDEPGAAVGIELSLAAGAAVAVAVGGNAEILPGADGAARLPMARGDGAWDSRALGRILLALRERAEKALARPVTHAVIAAAATADADRATLAAAAEAAGLRVLRVMDVAAAAALARGSADAATLGAAIQAEDDAAVLGVQGT
jgi:Ethanolamine utilization protein EutJ (predicted chaperonin)